MIDLHTAYKAVNSDLMQLAAQHNWAVASWWPNGGRNGHCPANAAEAIERVESVGRYHETRLAKEERRQRGTHLTPGSVALDLVSEMIALSGPRTSVLDPCCGAGIFLVAAQLSHATSLNLYGNDLNETALAWCWASFALALPDRSKPPSLKLTHGDGLLIDLPRCDTVLTNPPFRTSMRRVSDEERKRFAAYRQSGLSAPMVAPTSVWRLSTPASAVYKRMDGLALSCPNRNWRVKVAPCCASR